MLSLCNGWEFTKEWNETFAAGGGEAEAVRLPHSVSETPLHYADHLSYQMVCGYRHTIVFDESLRGQRHFIQFDGDADCPAKIEAKVRIMESVIRYLCVKQDAE